MNRAPRVALLTLLLTAGLARAQNTQLLFEASANQGLSWHDRVDVAPDSTVLVRLTVRLINVGTSTVLGLAGVTLQPRLSNWNPSLDTRLPFTTPDGSGVPIEPQTNVGRVYPFASSVMGTASTSGLLTSHVDAGNILRFAGANCITPTTNLAWGVGLGQLPINNNPTGFRSGHEAVVFRYAVRVGGENRSLRADVDLATIVQARGNWYRFAGAPSNLLAPVVQDTILPAEIRVLPAPSSLIAFLALAPLLTRRRP